MIFTDSIYLIHASAIPRIPLSAAQEWSASVMQESAVQHRVKFDFEIDFANGGGIQGQAFRLDIDGEDIDDRTLGDLIVRDLRLLMVAAVRILKKEIIREPHKRLQ